MIILKNVTHSEAFRFQRQERLWSQLTGALDVLIHQNCYTYNILNSYHIIFIGDDISWKGDLSG